MSFLTSKRSAKFSSFKWEIFVFIYSRILASVTVFWKREIYIDLVRWANGDVLLGLGGAFVMTTADPRTSLSHFPVPDAKLRFRLPIRMLCSCCVFGDGIDSSR